MLIGRHAECERIEALITRAAEGGSGALLLHGEAGIGKTALLGSARDAAEARGMRVLTARGIETEADLAYHGLYDLLHPLLAGGEVALVVARGATNKEAAAQLFLSPETVEHHLGAIYRKLDVRSRTDLARLLSTQREPEEAAA